MEQLLSRRRCLGKAAALSAFGVGNPWMQTGAIADALSDAEPSPGRKGNQVLVTPDGPADGGDFGPKTPGTKTSGLQEALDTAKATAKDLYVSGGSWTAGKTQPIVYFLQETLHVPWMQNFRMDGGNYVIHYTPKTGDAVVFDSQMSSSYRFGLIVSLADGAVVRLKPMTSGPDRFKVITSTEFHFNALVGGGGAWPGGEPHNSTLDQTHHWVGSGLWLDGSTGSIDCNHLRVTEVVGCGCGVLLTGATTNNALHVTTAHLCQNHLQVGDRNQPNVHNNQIQAHLESQGIPASTGARIFGHNNQLDLTFGQMGDQRDVIFEASSRDNLVRGIRFPHGITNRATTPTNRVISNTLAALGPETPKVPPSGETVVNRNPFPVEVLIVDPGIVLKWTETNANGNRIVFPDGLRTGQSFTLNPADGVSFQYSKQPSWVWKGIG